MFEMPPPLIVGHKQEYPVYLYTFDSKWNRWFLNYESNIFSLPPPAQPIGAR
jgi:hypothetical protein